MKLVIAGTLAAISLAAISFGQTAPDLSDKVCVMYQLSAAEEAQYDANSPALSDFWAIWDQKNASALTVDYVFMASDNPLYAENRTAGITFLGAHDAQITARIAYGAKGAYFYIAIEDQGAWTPYTAWQTDCSDFYLDIVSLTNMDPANWFNPTQWALTLDSKQFQIPFGGTTPAQINFRAYDAGSISVIDNLVDNNAPAQNGMNWKLVSVDATHKTVEWFLPYATWGLAGTPAANTRFCFAPGYNDVDDGVEGDVKSLRWVNLCDPYCAPDAINWGEIEAGPSLDGLAIVNKVAHTPSLTKAARSSEMYTLRGTKVSGSSNVAGLFVKRQVLANGTRTPASVTIAR